MLSGECKPFMQAFLKCMKDSKFDSSLCRVQSEAYLKCMMERYRVLLCALMFRELMAKEDLANLGFGQSEQAKQN